MNEHALSRHARREGTVALDTKPKWLRDIYSYLEQEVSGKDVLNIGAAGDVYRYLPKLADEWPHARLAKVAHSITGIDIDKDAIAHCANYGWSLVHGDCETFSLDRQFDCAVT